MNLLLDTCDFLWFISGDSALPPHHRDPFERMLVCQALESDLYLASSDPVMRQYGVELI